MKIKEVLKLITENKNTSALLRGVALIGLVIAISAISVHYLTGDTLSEYAKNNPDIAYSSENSVDSSNEASDNSSVTADEASNVSSAAADEASNDGSVTAEAADPADESSLNEDSDAPGYGILLSSVNVSSMVHFYTPTVDEDGLLISNADPAKPERVNYSEGFYYEPLTDEMIEYITGTSYPADEEDLQVSPSDLRYVGVLYNDFNGLTQAGELICNEYIAEDLVEIFSELYLSDYRFEKIVLVDNYGGDDKASMCADNTSCFNYRVVEGQTSLSKHAYGLAIDINPFYNPYLVFGGNEDGSDYISPPGSEVYVDRSQNFAYKIDESDLCYKLFTEHGFIWGGNWNSCKDYQHFQKVK